MGKRFTRYFEQSNVDLGSDIIVIVDNNTNVEYLQVETPKGLAVCPLLGADGKPVLHTDSYMSSDEIEYDYDYDYDYE